LIISGRTESREKYRKTNTTFQLDSFKDFQPVLINSRARIVSEIKEVQTGWNMTAIHPDGLVVEYVEHKKNI
jgi:hypothetical protein